MVEELSESQIDALISNSRYGHLGCQLNGKTYVVPINFAVMDGDLVAHTTAGMKIRFMRDNPSVCVQFEDIHNLTEWESAIVWGEFEELSGIDAVHAEQHLIDRYGPIFEDNPSGERGGREFIPPRTDGKPAERIIYRIRVAEKSGRSERSQDLE